jgi:hypothetical protein
MPTFTWRADEKIRSDQLDHSCSPAIGCFATVALRIKGLSGPVEPNEPPQDLTPASRRLVPSFRSSSPPRPLLTNFGKQRARANLKSQCRFRSEVPVTDSRPALQELQIGGTGTTRLHRPRLRRRLACPETAHGEQSALRSHRTPDAARVHRISSRVRDDRDTPLVWDETAAGMRVIWGKTEQEYFSLWEWTSTATPNLARRAAAFGDNDRQLLGRVERSDIPQFRLGKRWVSRRAQPILRASEMKADASVQIVPSPPFEA